MKKKTAICLGVMAFFLICGIESGLAWLAGYNFDSRGPGVAYFAFCVFAIAGMAAVFIATEG
jgi:hypothetical protein